MKKVVNLKSMVSVHCKTLFGHVTTMRTSCFDTRLASQVKLTNFPLIHCFGDIVAVQLILTKHSTNIIHVSLHQYYPLNYAIKLADTPKLTIITRQLTM